MTTIVEDFKAFLLASTSINDEVAGRCHYNVVPEDAKGDRIWFQRIDRENVLTTTGVLALRKVTFDVECASTSAADAETLADKVAAKLDGHAGAFNNATAQMIRVEDRDDNYEPKSHGGDEGIHIFALNVSIWHTT